MESGKYVPLATCIDEQDFPQRTLVICGGTFVNPVVAHCLLDKISLSSPSQYSWCFHLE